MSRLRAGSPNRVQLKAMLEYMGMPLNDQPTKLVQVQALLRTAASREPDRYKKIYNVLVLGMDPESVGAKDDKDMEVAMKVIKIANDHVRELVEGAEVSINNKTVDVIANLESIALKIAKDAIAEAAQQHKTIHIKIGNKSSKKIDGVLPEWFEHACQLAQARKNILLVGPSGCGKTHVSRMIAEAFELEFSSQSCTAGMSESILTGWLLPTGSNAKFIYTMAEFVRIYESGGVFLFDEIDASDPNVLLYINQALAQSEFYLPIRYEKPMVKKHKDFIAIAAANTYGNGADAMHHARNAIDAATLDRFRIGVISVDYSIRVEEALVDPDILSWGRLIRKIINNNHLLKVMSTRFLLDATDMKRYQEWSLDKIKSIYFSDWSPEEKRIVGGVI